MLVKGLYTVESFDSNQNVKAVVVLDPNHDIFKGHFPSIPILPGVCMMQMVKELLEKSVSKKGTIQKANNLKFLAMINPTEVQRLNVDITIKESLDTHILFMASISSDATTYFKMTATLTF